MSISITYDIGDKLFSKMAVSVWNAGDMRPPKRVLCAYEAQELISLGNLKKICGTLKAIRLHLKEDRCLDTEIAFFDRMHYKLRNVFKSDKQMQATRKVRNCLKRVCRVNIGRYCSDVYKDIDSYTTKNGDSGHVYLPSRHMFLFILIRLQGTARLFAQAVIYLQEAFYYILQKTYLGHYVNVNVLLLASVSRLWVLLRGILLFILDWYRNLKPFVFKLKQAPDSANVKDSFKSLAAEDFPDDLSEWLGPDFKSYLQKKIVKPSAIDKSLHLLSGIMFDGKVNLDIDLKVDKPVAAEDQKNGLDATIGDAESSGTYVTALSEDFGVAVNRDIFVADIESKKEDDDEFVEQLKSVTDLKLLKKFCLTATPMEDSRFKKKQLKKLCWFLKDISLVSGKCKIEPALKQISDFWKHPQTLDKYSREELKSLAVHCLPTATKKSSNKRKISSTPKKAGSMSFQSGFDSSINESLVLLTSLGDHVRDNSSFDTADLDRQLSAIKTKRHLKRFYLKETKRRHTKTSGSDALTAHFTPQQWILLKRFLKDHFSDESKEKISAVRKQLERCLKSPHILDDKNTSKLEASKSKAALNSSKDQTGEVVNNTLTEAVNSSKKKNDKRCLVDNDDGNVSVRKRKTK